MPCFVVALALVAGCAGSSEPRTVQPVPSASPSLSPPPPLTPEEQVLAAVRAYYTEVDRASATGSVTALEALSIPSCDCRKLARGIRETYASGTRIVGARHVLIGPQLASFSPPGAAVTARLNVSAHELVQKDGSRKPKPADEFPITVRLAQKGGRWLIVAVEDAS